MATLFPHRLLLLRRTTIPLAALATTPSPSTFLFTPLKTTPSFTPPPFSYRSLFHTTPRAAVSQQIENDVVSLDNEETEEIEPETENRTIHPPIAAEGLKNLNVSGIRAPLPDLSVKEKKELGSYAHSLGKKLKSQQVGKSGVTDTVIMALDETLEKNELLKLKIHGNCPAEMEDAVKEIEERTGSVLVGQIGRTVILYRPSLTKMKAEEKKKQAQKIFLKRQAAFKQSSQIRRPGTEQGQEPRRFGRARRDRAGL